MDVHEQFKRAITFEEQGNYEEALRIYKAIINIDNTFRTAHINLGSLYYRMQQYEQALDCFGKALHLKEDYIVLFNIGSLLFRVGQYKKAIIALNQSIALNPSFYIAILVKGIAFSKLHNYKAALSCFVKVLTTNPDNQVALTAIILLYYEKKEYDKAIQYLRQYEYYFSSFKYKDIACDIILHCAATHNNELVKHSLQKREYRKFDDYIATVPAQVFHDSKGSIDEKIKQLEATIHTDPDPATFISLSLCHLFSGNNEKALYYLANAARIH